MKRFIAFCLSIGMLTSSYTLSMSNNVVCAEQESDENEIPPQNEAEVFETDLFRYHVEDGNVIIDRAIKPLDINTPLIIPSEVDGMPVTEIGDNAFSLCEMAEVTIPDSVQIVGIDAFGFCGNLQKVNLPEIVPEFIGQPFYNTPYMEKKNIETPIWIENGVLLNVCTDAEQFTIPEGVQKIGAMAFCESTSIKEITIPNGVTLNRRAFEYQRTLTTVNLPETLTEIPERAFSYCTALNSMNIPDSVSKIGEMAFNHCESLRSLEVSDNLTSIGITAFADCPQLMLYASPDSYAAKFAGENGVMCSVKGQTDPADVLVKYHVYFDKFITIDGVAKENSFADTLEIPPEIYGIPVTRVNSNAFENCKQLKKVILPENLQWIESNAFKGCDGLTEIAFPSTLKICSDDAFDECWALKKFIFADGWEKIHNIQLGTSLDNIEIVLPDSVREIDASAFEGMSNIIKINIPDGVTRIGSRAFFGCSKLTEVTLPESVKVLETEAFGGCKSLKAINMPADIKFKGNPFSGSLFGEEHIKQTPVWCYNGYLLNVRSDEEKFVVPEGVHTICSDAFLDCGKVREVTIPDGVEIADGAFQYSPLRKIELPDTLEVIPEHAFFNCKNLNSINIPQNVTRIERDAFAACTNLSDVNINENIAYIGPYAFWACYKLTEVTIPGNVKKIESESFSGNPELKTVKIMDGVDEIGDSAFKGDSGIVCIEIPESVTKIGAWAFEDNNKMIIIGKKGSYAEQYAKNCRFTFIDLSENDNAEETSVSLFDYEVKDDHVVIKGLKEDNKNVSLLVIPAYIENLPVTVIDEYAFAYNNHLTKVIIPEGIKEICYSAFLYCENLKLISLPNSLESIGNDALYTNKYGKPLILQVDQGSYAESYANEYCMCTQTRSNNDLTTTSTTAITTVTTFTTSTTETQTSTTAESTVTTAKQTTTGTLPQTGTNGTESHEPLTVAFVMICAGVLLTAYSFRRKDN